MGLIVAGFWPSRACSLTCSRRGDSANFGVVRAAVGLLLVVAVVAVAVALRRKP